MKEQRFYQTVCQSLSMISLVLVISTFGCTSLKMRFSKQSMIKISPSEYPRFTDNMFYDGLAHGITQSISYLNRMPKAKEFTFGKDVYHTQQMIRSLEDFRVSGGCVRRPPTVMGAKAPC